MNRPTPPEGPLVQSVTIGFRALTLATLAFALLWLGSNIREVPAGSRAAVLRFGRIVRVQEAGLLLALPRPIEAVRLLPGAQRQLSQVVSPLPPLPGSDGFARGVRTSPHGSAGSYLTGDGGVVLLDATLTYGVSDPASWLVAEAHVPAALDRLFRAAAIDLIAGRNLDDLLVARPERAAAGGAQAVAALRQSLRDDLTKAIAARLDGLTRANASLGVRLERLDLTAWLPPAANDAFNAVLTAGQNADRGIAQARTDAARTAQAGDQQRDRILAEAHATAAERISRAEAQTAPIQALARATQPATRDALLDQVYRARIATLIRQAGSVTAVAPNSRDVILPGTVP